MLYMYNAACAIVAMCTNTYMHDVCIWSMHVTTFK